MEIHFRDKKLRELCEQRAVAVKQLGDICARKLRARLDDLESAGNVTDLLAGSPPPAQG